VPGVSVILPTRNRAGLVVPAMRSVLSQSFADLELIVVDDASADATSELVAALPDPRVRLLRLEARAGAGGARNRGAATATAPLLAFQDSDDEWLPDRLAATVAAMDGAGVDTVLVYTDMIRAEGRAERPYPAPRRPGRRRLRLAEALRFGVGDIGIQTTLLRADAFAAVGGFDETLPALEDFELFVRLSQRGRFLHVRRPLVRFQPRPEGLSNDHGAIVAAWGAIARKYAAVAAGDPTTRAFFLAAAGLHLDAGGDRDQGLRQLLQAARLAPLSGVGLRAFATWLRRRLNAPGA